MLRLLDAFYTFLHLAIIFFNLFGWIPKRTRKIHLLTIGLTAISWFILGIWFGMGYCPITEWQWQVKEKLGETNLPDSFIKYYGDKITGSYLDPILLNNVTAICFALTVILTIYMNFFRGRFHRTKNIAE